MTPLQALRDLELRYPALVEPVRTATIQALEQRKADSHRAVCKAQVAGFLLPGKAARCQSLFDSPLLLVLLVLLVLVLLLLVLLLLVLLLLLLVLLSPRPPPFPTGSTASGRERSREG